LCLRTEPEKPGVIKSVTKVMDQRVGRKNPPLRPPGLPDPPVEIRMLRGAWLFNLWHKRMPLKHGIDESHIHLGSSYATAWRWVELLLYNFDSTKHPGC
jgi:hypothetical protein